MVKDLKKKKNDGKNVPFGQTNHEDFNKKKIVQILLDIRSSFIWNSADGHY